MKHIDMVLKSLNDLSKHLEEIKATTGVNKMGVTHAAELVANGKISKPSSWNPPSANEENAYIKENGMSKYGMWFLGVDSNVSAEDKGHWHYIYTSDFKTVDRAALIAIRQRSGQQKQTDVFNAAGKLLEKIDA
jgi:hypothetical protein